MTSQYKRGRYKRLSRLSEQNKKPQKLQASSHTPNHQSRRSKIGGHKVRIEVGFAQAPRAPTLQAIANTYKSKTGLQTEEKELLQRLSETEKTGIIESAIANIQDKPSRI